MPRMYETNSQLFRGSYDMITTICDRCKKPIPPLNNYTYRGITSIDINYILPNPFLPTLSNNTDKRHLDICPV